MLGSCPIATGFLFGAIEPWRAPRLVPWNVKAALNQSQYFRSGIPTGAVLTLRADVISHAGNWDLDIAVGASYGREKARRSHGGFIHVCQSSPSQTRYAEECLPQTYATSGLFTACFRIFLYDLFLPKFHDVVARVAECTLRSCVTRA